MPEYKRHMYQDVTYWPLGVPDGYGGYDFSGVTPQLIEARWEDKAVLFRDANGREVTSSSIVYTQIQVANRGYLALGDHVTETDPKSLADAREIRQVDRSPDLRTHYTLNKAYL